MSDDELIEAIDETGEDLTEWEISFIEEMTRKVITNEGSLSKNERCKAEQIFDERCNP